MHGFFYRLFSKDHMRPAFVQLILGVVIGSVLGCALFPVLKTAEPLRISFRQNSNILSTIYTGFLPLFIVGIMIADGRWAAARVIAPGISSMLLCFSSLLLFQQCDMCSVAFLIFFFSGRILCLVPLFLFLLYADKRFGSRIWAEYLMLCIFIIAILSFFAWLLEPTIHMFFSICVK